MSRRALSIGLLIPWIPPLVLEALLRGPCLQSCFVGEPNPVNLRSILEVFSYSVWPLCALGFALIGIGLFLTRFRSTGIGMICNGAILHFLRWVQLV